MYILDDEQVIYGGADLTHRGEKGVGKDVFVDPGGVHRFRPAVADRMKKKKSVIVQTSVHDLHEGPVVSGSDMLEHPYRDNMVKRFIQVPVVQQSQFDWQSFAQLHTQFLLLPADSNADDRHPISLDTVTGKAAQPQPMSRTLSPDFSPNFLHVRSSFLS